MILTLFLAQLILYQDIRCTLIIIINMNMVS